MESREIELQLETLRRSWPVGHLYVNDVLVGDVLSFSVTPALPTSEEAAACLKALLERRFAPGRFEGIGEIES